MLLGLALAASLLLIFSDFQTLYAVKVLTVVKRSVSGHEQHSFAIALIGFAAVAMTAAAAAVGPGRARAATAALGLLGVAGLLIALIGDLSQVNSTGEIGQLYDSATAGPRAGFYLETLGTVGLIFSGGSLLVLTASARRPRRAGAASPAPLAAATAVAPVNAEDEGWVR